MRIAIVHYHRRRGGVTRVIDTTAKVLREAGDTVAIVSGESVAGLDYADLHLNPAAGELADALESRARAVLADAPDVWHIHNHHLGRNPAATAAFQELARRGHRVLFHIHDFPEDGRPANYRALHEALGGGLSDVLYPAASHVHYAVLNARDREALLRAGIPTDQLHLLPNPIELTPVTERPGVSDLALYPTRALRRKNIGEFLLWATLDTRGWRYGLTLAPTSPDDLRVYRAWQAFAAERRLPVDFEMGLRDESLEDLFARAACVVTTSIAEGFGLAFLEPWLAGVPLVGRGLPDIMGDLPKAGLDLAHLYARLEVPLHWLGADAVRARVQEAFIRTLSAYDRRPAGNAPERAWQASIRGNSIDFGRLDEPLQQRVIERVLHAPDERAELRPAELAVDLAARRLQLNANAVARAFHPAEYREKLQAVYRTITDAPQGHLSAHDADAVLEYFLDPQRFSLLRAS